MSDPIDVGLEEIRLLRARLRRLEQMAAAQAPDKPTPGFGDALRQLGRDGTASGPAISELRRQITERPEPTPAPDAAQLAAATRRVVGGLRGSATIAGAFEAMQARQARLDSIETSDPGGSGRADPSDPTATPAARRLDAILKGQRQ